MQRGEKNIKSRKAEKETGFGLFLSFHTILSILLNPDSFYIQHTLQIWFSLILVSDMAVEQIAFDNLLHIILYINM